MKFRVALAVATATTTLALGGCAFLTPNWDALHPTKTPTATETTEAPTPTPTPTKTMNRAKVDVNIVYSSADSTGIDVVAQALNVSEDGGSCTITVSQAATKKTLTVKAESNVTDTQCFPIHLPLTGFVTGAATFTVSYESATAVGTSTVNSVDIP